VKGTTSSPKEGRALS